MIGVSWCEPNTTYRPPKVFEDGDFTSLAEIVRETCVQHKVTRGDLLSDRRARHVAWPRQEAMYRAYKETNLSLPAIGRYFGNRDHTTVMHAIKQVEKRMLEGPKPREAQHRDSEREIGT